MSSPQIPFSAHPLFWLALALASGVCLAARAGAAWPVLCLCGAVSVGAAVRAWGGRGTQQATWLLLLAFVSVGALLVTLERRNEAAAHRARRLYETGVIPSGAPVELTGVIDDAPELAPDGWYVRVRVEEIRWQDTTYRTGGTVALFAPVRDATQAAGYAALAWRYGSRLRLSLQLERAEQFRNPGVASRTEFLDGQDLDAVGTIKEPAAVQNLGVARVCPVLARLYGLRQDTAATLARTFDTDTAGVLQASLLGLRHTLSKDTAERFRAGGTFHILVISGFQITVLGLLARWLVRRVTRRRGWQFAGAASFIWLYALMVGGEVSVVRAALMFTVATLAPALHRSANNLNTLGGAALIWLVWRPADVFDASFQLTFLAVFAIIALAGPVWAKLETVGRWRPTYATPVPPGGPRWWRVLGETLFWSERAWQQELERVPYYCVLRKTPWAARLEHWRVQRVLRWLAGALWVSLCVQATMLPAAVLHFHRLAWASLLLNLAVGVLLGLLTVLAALALAIASVSQTIAALLVGLAHKVNYVLVHSVDPFTARGLASWRVPEYSGVWVMIYVLYFVPLVVLAACLARWHPCGWDVETGRLWRWAAPSLLVFGLLGAVIVGHPYSAPADGRLHIAWLDVGQGDAALLTMPDGTTILVDGGGRPEFGQKKRDDVPSEAMFRRDSRSIGEAVVSEYLWHRGLSRVDYLLATHADADHINGLNDIARNFAVRAALVGRTPSNNAEFVRFAATLRAQGIPLRVVGRGDTLHFGAVTLETLWPLMTTQADAPSGNNDSVVWRVRYGERAFLLTGDIETAAETQLAQQPDQLRADVVKAAHHGSRTSSTAAFIAAVQPKYVVVSVGQSSPYGHPHAEVVGRWRDSGAQFWTTGTKGLIEFSTDGHDLQLEW